MKLEYDAFNVVREFNGLNPLSPLGSMYSHVRELFHSVGGGSSAAIVCSTNSMTHLLIISISSSIKDKVWIWITKFLCLGWEIKKYIKLASYQFIQ